jgi:bifunctional ADP-heptose synthase (sugar kinase/adenylyltransferase)
VCVFDEDTPEALIGALLPDVLVKGADYTLEQVVGRQIVQGRGGRVELLPLLAGRSTTALIQRAKEVTP